MEKKKALKVIHRVSYYFQYIGPLPGSYSDFIDPNNYVEALGGPEDLCPAGYDVLCMILTDRIWSGFKYQPDFSDTSQGNISSQLYTYSFGGPAGTRIFLREL